MSIKDFIYIIYFNKSFYKNYKLTMPLEEFKTQIRSQILQKRKYNPSIFNKNHHYFYGMFSGLYGRRLNLKKLNNPKFTFSPFKTLKLRLRGPGLEIKCYLIPIDSHSFNLNVKFKSISFYYIWIPLLAISLFIIMLTIVSSIFTEFNWFSLFIYILMLLLFQIIMGVPMIYTLKKDFLEFENNLLHLK